MTKEELKHILGVIFGFNLLIWSSGSTRIAEVFVGEDWTTIQDDREYELIFAQDFNNVPIFVSITAFRDGTRCGATLRHMFHNVSTSRKLFVSVLEQRSESDLPCLNAYARELPGGLCDHTCDQVTVLTKPHFKASGPITARHQLQQLQIQAREEWRLTQDVGVDAFYMQLDSHMMFVRDWDNELFASWSRTGNRKSILTAYVPSFDQGRDGLPRHICHTMFTGEGVPTIGASLPVRNAIRPIRSALYSGHFVFGPSLALLDLVPYDEKFTGMFYGEELMMAARLFTWGYDTYSPDVAVVMHDYTAFHMRPWRWDYLNLAHSLRRAYHLLGMPGGEVINGQIDSKFGLGHERDMSAWLQVVGMDFEKRRVLSNQCLSNQLLQVASESEGKVDPAAPRRPNFLPVFGMMDNDKAVSELDEMIKFAENVAQEEAFLGLEGDPLVAINLIYLTRRRLERAPTKQNYKLARLLLKVEGDWVSTPQCDKVDKPLQSRCGLELSRLHFLVGAPHQSLICANYSVAQAVLPFEVADALTQRASISWPEELRSTSSVESALLDLEKALLADPSNTLAHRLKLLFLREKFAPDILRSSVAAIGAAGVVQSSPAEIFERSLEATQAAMNSRPQLTQLVGLDMLVDAVGLYDLHAAVALAHDSLASLSAEPSFHATAAQKAFGTSNGYLNAAQRQIEPSVGVEESSLAMRISKKSARARQVFRTPSLWRSLHSSIEWRSNIKPIIAPIFVIGGKNCESNTLISALVASSVRPTHGVDFSESGPKGVMSGASSVFSLFADEAMEAVSSSLARGDKMSQLIGVVQRQRDLVMEAIEEVARRHGGIGQQERLLDYGPELWLHTGIIHLLFPEALILHARSEVAGCIAEMWQGLTAAGEALARPNWSLSLPSTVLVVKEKESLIHHWEAVIPANLFVLEAHQSISLFLSHIGISPPDLAHIESSRGLTRQLALQRGSDLSPGLEWVKQK